MNLFGIVGIFSGGLMEMAAFNFIPLMRTHAGAYLLALGIGLAFSLIFFVSFRALILVYDLKTPGREDHVANRAAIDCLTGSDFAKEQSPNDEVDSRSDQDHVLAERVIQLLGGVGNIVGATNCASRLRVEFTLAGNDLAEPGERTVYVRITSPDGYVLTTEAMPTFEFEGEHRLEQRQFRTPSPTAADTLHHVTLTPQRVGQQVHDHRAVAVLERIEHDSPRLVCLERSRHLTLSLRAPSPSRRAYALRPAPARRPEPEPR